jgi:hypothetical protein
MLALERPLRPRGIDLASPLRPLANGAASARDGGERVGWRGRSTASGVQEDLEPEAVGRQPHLSLGVLPSTTRDLVVVMSGYPPV